jgi:hypothetical protein
MVTEEWDGAISDESVISGEWNSFSQEKYERGKSKAMLH